MLQPQYRDKLPEQLSYPVGAEVLSRELEKHSDLPDLELVFRASPISSTSNFQQLIARGLPHVILRVYFARWDKSVSIGNDPSWQKYLRGVWSLSVYPVRRILKSKAREALITAGLPLVAGWMTRRRDPSWYYGRKECEIQFDTDDGTVEFR
jgi:hypothetical protein